MYRQSPKSTKLLSSDILPGISTNVGAQLFSFFRSTSTSKERKELVIMITPTLVDENTPGKMSDDMKKWVEQTDKAGGGTNKNTAENTLADKTTAGGKNCKINRF